MDSATNDGTTSSARKTTFESTTRMSSSSTSDGPDSCANTGTDQGSR